MLLLAASVGVFFLLLVLGLIVVIPKPSSHQFLVFRIVLALAGAALSAALIAGSILVRLDFDHLGLVSASGAFAVFVILYFFSPKMLPVRHKSESSDRHDQD